MRVRELRRVLNKVLDNLEDYEDEQEVHMVSNTYFLGQAMYFLGISGYDGGYINLDNLEIEDEEDEEDE